MIVKNLSELIPHIMILLIFWIIPEKINIKSQAIIYVIIYLIKDIPKKDKQNNYQNRQLI